MATTNERFGNQSTSMTPGSSDQSAKSNLATLGNAAGDQLAEVAGQAQQAAQVQLDNLADAIRQRPIQATGIAAAVGFVLALLARR
jgi:ElaB/YqjD/DUF883 family membrane-anchored ribosome-binding protein